MNTVTYHLAEVHTLRDDTNTLLGYRAFCKCGWYGLDRDTKPASDEDAYAHDVTENDAIESGEATWKDPDDVPLEDFHPDGIGEMDV